MTSKPLVAAIGSLDVETTVRETTWHWYRFVLDCYSYAGEDREIVRQRRLSDVRHRTFLIYRLDVARDRFTAQRSPRRAWIRLAPGALG